MSAADCMFPYENRHLFWSHMYVNVPDSKKMDMPYANAGTSQWMRAWGYERFCLHGDKVGVLELLLDKVAKSCRLEGQD